jgi:hypothetical protein
MAARALDGLGDGRVDLLGEVEHEGQGLDVAVPDPAAAGADDARVLIVLDLSTRAF